MAVRNLTGHNMCLCSCVPAEDKDHFYGRLDVGYSTNYKIPHVELFSSLLGHSCMLLQYNHNNSLAQTQLFCYITSPRSKELANIDYVNIFHLRTVIP